MKYSYSTKGVCSKLIEFEINDNIVSNVQYTGGCHGNLQAVGRLVEGLTTDEVISRLEGIRCGFKDTSCGDQLAQALKQAKEKM